MLDVSEQINISPDTVRRILKPDPEIIAATPVTDINKIDTSHIDRIINATPLEIPVEPKPPVESSQEPVVFKGQKMARLTGR